MPPLTGYLLKEDGSRLLTEAGGGIVLDYFVRLTFTLPTPTLSSTVRRSHTPLSRVELLSADLTAVIATLDQQLLDGSVVSDRASDAGVSASVRVVNDGSVNGEALDELLINDAPVRISRGAVVDGAAVLVPLITGIVALPTDKAFSAAWAFSVNSRLTIAKRNFTGPTTISGGRGRDSIRTLAELGGLGTSDAWYNLDDGGVIVPARTFDSNDEILGAMVKWAFDMGCDLWPAADGSTWMAPFVDPSTVTPTFDFGTDILLGFSHQTARTQAYNRQVVYGRDADGYEIKAEAKITNPAHPLFWRADYDLPAKPYSSPDISTYAIALSVAQRLLSDAAAEIESVDAESLAIPTVAARNVASFSGAGYGSGFLLDRVAMPITQGSMSTSSRRTRAVALA